MRVRRRGTPRRRPVRRLSRGTRRSSRSRVRRSRSAPRFAGRVGYRL